MLTILLIIAWSLIDLLGEQSVDSLVITGRLKHELDMVVGAWGVWALAFSQIVLVLETLLSEFAVYKSIYIVVADPIHEDLEHDLHIENEACYYVGVLIDPFHGKT